jgi:hypothetical protein
MKRLPELQRCIACGVPLTEAMLGEPGKGCCRSCTLPDGSMVPYEKVLSDLAAHLVRTLDLDESAARALAAERLSRLPAWQRRASRKRGAQ